MKAPVWTLLALLLICPCSFSQQADTGQSEPEEVSSEATEPETETDPPTPPAEEVVEVDPATEDTSPFDYRASEQISEDLSVSFPVDI